MMQVLFLFCMLCILCRGDCPESVCDVYIINCTDLCTCDTNFCYCCIPCLRCLGISWIDCCGCFNIC